MIHDDYSGAPVSSGEAGEVHWEECSQRGGKRGREVLLPATQEPSVLR